MADEWYCEIAGREIGPLSSEQLRAMAVKGQILPNDCVRQGAARLLDFGPAGAGIASGGVGFGECGCREIRTAVQVPPVATGGRFSAARIRKWKPRETDPGKGDSPIFADTKIGTVPRESAGGGAAAEGDLGVSIAAQAPPVAPPMAADVFDPVALGIVTDLADVKIGVQSQTTSVRSRERRRLERQRMIVGVLVAAVVGLAIVGLLLSIGDRQPQSEPSGSATPAKKARPVKAAASPEALEAREGIESLDSPKPKPRKIGVPAAKTPVADSSRVKAAVPSDSPKAVAPQSRASPSPARPRVISVCRWSINRTGAAFFSVRCSAGRWPPAIAETSSA